MSISKKIRFEVFKRDGFKCAYCGRVPPEVILEIDHIDPKSKGGEDNRNNLITACFDCNRGKSDIPLSNIPSSLAENMEIIKEREEQIKAYRKLLKQVDKRINKDINDIEKIYIAEFPNYELRDRFKQTTIRRFLEILPKEKVEKAMYLAVSKSFYNNASERCLKYFCAVCWNWARNEI